MNDLQQSQLLVTATPEEHSPLASFNTLGTLVRAEIDTQIATAHMYPRSLGTFKKAAISMACLDVETASSCFYALKRSGKTIEGPSVRLAEIVASAWGNVRYGSRVIEIGQEFITAEGSCHDLERNVASTSEVRRRIKDSKGRRYSDDMIVVTANAACAVAMRNAIFKVVPGAFIKPVLDSVRQTAIGDARTLADTRATALDYFHKMGLTDERILATLDRQSVEDIGLEDVATLKGLATAIKDGETTVDEAFPLPSAPKKDAPNGTQGQSRSQQLASQLAEREPGTEG